MEINLKRTVDVLQDIQFTKLDMIFTLLCYIFLIWPKSLKSLKTQLLNKNDISFVLYSTHGGLYFFHLFNACWVDDVVWAHWTGADGVNTGGLT